MLSPVSESRPGTAGGQHDTLIAMLRPLESRKRSRSFDSLSLHCVQRPVTQDDERS